MNRHDDNVSILWGLSWLVLIILVLTGVFSLINHTSLVNKPAENKLIHNANETDPGLVQSRRQTLIKLLTDIKKQEAQISMLNGDKNARERAKSSLAAMQDELVEKAKLLDESLLPPSVSQYITINSRQVQ
jgi:hypothetical protein